MKEIEGVTILWNGVDLARADKADKWISVDNGLPKHGVVVWVFAWGKVWEGCYHELAKAWGTPDSWRIHDVTHWQEADEKPAPPVLAEAAP